MSKQHPAHSNDAPTLNRHPPVYSRLHLPPAIPGLHSAHSYFLVVKRTPLKRKPWKPKKRATLRRVSKRPLRTLLLKADRALQDYYRTKKLPCEVCGKQSNIVHHFIEKSRSAALRFSDENLAPLCNGCHFRHHRVGDPDIAATIVLKRGAAWYKRLQLLRRATISLNKTFLETQLQRFQ
jgi:5-methylcytosine-specific restriction endonuclease McrA